MQTQLAEKFLIHEWKIDCNKCIASNGNEEVRLEPKSMMILQYLASRAGEVVTRNELFELFWPNQVVTEDALNRVMSNLRRLFKDNSSQPRFIMTIRKVGYKVVAPITTLPAPEEAHVLSQSTAIPLKTDIRHKPRASWRISGKRDAYLAVTIMILTLMTSVIIYSHFIGSTEDTKQQNIFKRVTYDKADNLMSDISNDEANILFIGGTQKTAAKLMYRSLDKTYAVNIGSNNKSYSYPTFSYDKNKIAAISSINNNRTHHIDVMDLSNGKVINQLNIASASFGLDGHPTKNILAFTQNHIDQKNHGIFIWQPQLNQQQLITFSIAGVEDRFPKFSPDGEQIAFSRRVAATESAIFITDLQGNTKQISAFESKVYGFDWFDSEHLLISTIRGIEKYSLNGQKKLVEATERFPAYFDLSYAPKTNKLFFSDNNIQHEGHLVDFNLRNSYPLTESKSSDTELTISPNAQSFVFISNRTDTKSLWHRKGNEINSIPNTEFDDIYDLNWSPDSNQLAAIVKTSNLYGLLTFSLATSNVSVAWQGEQPMHLIGWKSNDVLLFSQLTLQKYNRIWQLKQYQPTEQQSIDISTFDIYQARLAQNAEFIVFMDSTRMGLWRWDWQGQPQKIPNSDKLSLDRNWDISRHLVWGVDNNGNIFNLDMHSGELELALTGGNFDANFRPKKRLYGLSATKKVLSDSDLWMIQLAQGSD